MLSALIAFLRKFEGRRQERTVLERRLLRAYFERVNGPTWFRQETARDPMQGILGTRD